MSQKTTGDLISATDFNEIERRKPTGATVATSETGTMTAYTGTQPATAGPAVTVTTGTMAFVTLYCSQANSNAGIATFMGFAITGATTVAASDAFALEVPNSTASVGTRCSATFLVTGLTPGTNTFTAKYKTVANTATFSDRRITVEPVD